MSDTPSPEPTSPAEADTLTTVTNISGGVNLDARHDVNIGGDVIGGDKITANIDTGGGTNIAGNVTLSEGSEFVGRDKIIYEASTPIATSLHQLPPPPRDFTGREAELADLTTKAETDGVTISGFRGMGGVGKTTLALVLAERLKPRYPDAQFYLDLKGVDKQPLSVTAALKHVIRAYHPTAKLPESETELRALYMTVLEGQRALLLMDNAADKTQVEPLIPPPSCFLLVTSRQHFALPGLFARDLNTLPLDEARDLLLKIAPRIGNQVDTLAKLCGYLPLALRLAGSALAQRRTLTPTDYVKRLEDAQTRLELVEASLSLSYDLLSAELQQVWCTLAVFPDTFDLAAAAAVWNVEMSLAQDQLDELMRYSLVDWNETVQRARLHNLARLFADKHLGDTARMANQRRYASHYQIVSSTANDLYCQGGEWLMQGLALFDLEWTNIQNGHAWAAQYADTDMRALVLCDDYPAQCTNLLPLRQHPRDHIQWLETAITASRKLILRYREGIHLIALGDAYRHLSEYRRAIEYHEQALAIMRELGTASYNETEGVSPHIGEANSLSALGQDYSSLGEYRRTIEYYEQALAVIRTIDATPFGKAKQTIMRHNEGATLGDLGNAYRHLGDHRRAIDYEEQALIIMREIGALRDEAECLGNLGSVYHSLSEYRRAIEYYSQAFAIAHEIGDRRSESASLGSLGSAYYRLNDYARARECYEQKRAITCEIGDRRGEAYSLWGLAVCFSVVRDRPQAVAYAQAALDIFTAIESPHAQTMRELLAQWQQVEQ